MLDGERLSPELVLVSPDLAARARALLPDRPGYPNRSADSAGPSSARIESLVLPEVAREGDGHGASRGGLDGLTALVDKIATDSREIEQRLAQVESAIARMETARAVASTPAAPLLEAEPTTEDEGHVSSAAPERGTKTSTGLAGMLVVVASVIAAMVTVELLPFGDRPRLAVVSEGAPEAVKREGVPSVATGKQSSGGQTTSESPVPPPSRSAAAKPQPEIDTPRATTAARPATPKPPRTKTTTTKAATTTQRTRTTKTPAPPPRAPVPNATSANSFEPARVFVWPAAPGAALYDVTFFLNGRPFYSTRVLKPRLTLPEKIQFTPGSYRWIVRPGAVGEALRNPIVDSTFTIERS